MYYYSCGSANTVVGVGESEKSQQEANSKKEDKMQEATQVAAKHILIKIQDKDESKDKGKDEAEKLLAKIQNNEISFEYAAKTYSKCPSGANGGDLGFFEKGMMVKEFEDAAFLLNVGEISKPIKTRFGWHLIKVYGKK